MIRWFRRRGSRTPELERSLQYRFSDPALLEMALTHRSHTHERGQEQWTNYERLEYLGDALLGFLVADWLYRRDPRANEGTLSRRRQSVVRTQPLAETAERIGLGESVLLGRGEERTGGRQKQSLLADTFEATLAAIYLDGGIRPSREFVERHLEPILHQAMQGVEAGYDFKTRLQEAIQSKLQPPPRYRIVSTSGPAHRQEFEVEVAQGSRILGTGTGTNRKKAEQEAARQALECLGRLGDESECAGR